jgi:hypothetical protein
MCAVPRKRKYPEYCGLRDALDAQPNFTPFRLAEASGSVFPWFESYRPPLPNLHSVDHGRCADPQPIKVCPPFLAPRACAPYAICPSCQSAARQRACTVGQIKSTVSSIPPRAEGRYGRSSRNVGRGMRWTRRCRVRLRSQGRGHTREQSREAHETSGIVAYGEVVWSWHPLLVLSARGGTFSPTGM